MQTPEEPARRCISRVFLTPFRIIAGVIGEGNPNPRHILTRTSTANRDKARASLEARPTSLQFFKKLFRLHHTLRDPNIEKRCMLRFHSQIRATGEQ